MLFILNCPFPEHHVRLHNVQRQRCRPVQITHNVNEDGWRRLKNIHLQARAEERAALFTIATLMFFALITSNQMMVTLIIEPLGGFCDEFSFSVLNMGCFFPFGVNIVHEKFGGLWLSWGKGILLFEE